MKHKNRFYFEIDPRETNWLDSVFFSPAQNFDVQVARWTQGQKSLKMDTAKGLFTRSVSESSAILTGIILFKLFRIALLIIRIFLLLNYMINYEIIN